jgi:medium-chain acyl-[acyl-carrier-protein] hydrolase
MRIDQNWYVEYKKNSNASVRLFCFHHSGGGASTYYPWVEHISPHIELISIQLPGRENRFTEPLTNNLQDIICNLTEEFHPYTDKPFFVFGHSLGALISFEFIQVIHKLYSIFPMHMIVSAARAPHLPFRMKHLSQLEDKELKEKLIIYNGIDERILHNDELLRLFLPIIKNDFSISENYHSKDSKPFPFDILALSGAQDPTVTQEEIIGWKEHTTGKFEYLSFQGGHFYIRNHQKSILNVVNKIGDNYIIEKSN